MDEPLSPSDAKRLLLAIIEHGNVGFSNHALNEFNDEVPPLTAEDALNVLRGGVVEPGEFVNDSYRYRVRTTRMYIVVAFRSETEAVVITAWRKK